MENLFIDFTSNDNTVRSQAEIQYTAYCTNAPNQVLSHLLSTLSEIKGDPIQTSMAVVMLRRAFVSSWFSTLTRNVHVKAQTSMLQLFMKNTFTPRMSMQFSHALGELSGWCVDHNVSWGHLIPTIMTCVSTVGCESKGLTAVARIAEYAPSLLKQMELSYILKHLCHHEKSVQMEAMKAILLVSVHVEAGNLLRMQSGLPHMVTIMQHLLNSGQEERVCETLEAFISLVESQPTFVRPYLTELGEAMLAIATCEALEDGTRELAIEFLLTLSEHAGGMIRKCHTLLKKLLPLAMSLVASVEDDEAWTSRFDHPLTFTEGDASGISETGASALDRMATSLGGTVVLPIVLPFVELYLNDVGDWRKRRAALYTLCLLGEGCKASMTPLLPVIVPQVVKCTTDSHPRVRHAAVHCLGQMADDFGSAKQNFQESFHGNVLPAFAVLLGNKTEIPRIHALVGSALTNFCNPDRCTARQITPYVDALLSHTFYLLSNSPLPVLEQLVTSVGCIAKVLGEGFSPYYAPFMPIATSIVTTYPREEKYILVRGKAMEAIALIGQSVGKERFANDAHALLHIVLPAIATATMESVESQYLMQSCARIGNVLKEDFLPYMPHLLPLLMKMATLEPEVELKDVMGPDEGDLTDDNGMHHTTVHIAGVGKKRLGINTTCLEEKTTAVHMIYQFMLDLEGAFLPYLENVIPTLISLLKFQYSEDIRSVSALSMSALLTVVATSDEYETNAQYLQQQGGIASVAQRIFAAIFPPLVTAFQKEEDVQVVVDFTEALSSVLEVCYEHRDTINTGLSPQVLPKIIQAFANMISETCQSMLARTTANEADEDFDQVAEEQQEEQLEMEISIVRNLIDAIGYVIKASPAVAYSAVEAYLFPIYPIVLHESMLPDVRAQGICNMDDLIEHCAPQVQSHLPTFVQHLMTGVSQHEPSVLQASAYGLGICAQYGGKAFDPFVTATLSQLISIIEHRNSSTEDEEEAAAMDNAISAVLKFAVYRNNGSFPVSDLFAKCLSWLPLQSDVEEAQDVHRSVMTQLFSGNRQLLGDSFQNVPRILHVLSTILLLQREEMDDMEILDEESALQMGVLVQSLQQTIPVEMFTSAVSVLTREQQYVLQHPLSQ